MDSIINTRPQTYYDMQHALREYNRMHSVYALSTFVFRIREHVKSLGYTIAYGDNIEIDAVDLSVKLRVSAQLKYVTVYNVSVSYLAGDTVVEGEKLNEMFKWASDLPTAEAHRRVQWKQKLVDLQTEGEELNMGYEYTEMLRATAERLASNALENKS